MLAAKEVKAMNDFVIENEVLIKYVGENEDVVVPQGITTIGALSFVGRPIKSVSIPEGVVAIGDKAFYECAHLTNVVIPKSVEIMSANVFFYCSALTDIYCEAQNASEEWHDNWKNNRCPATVYWGNQWEYVNNVSVLKQPSASL
jgi:hypothetical protein